jgi:hypothetical protein
MISGIREGYLISCRATACAITGLSAGGCLTCDGQAAIMVITSPQGNDGWRSATTAGGTPPARNAGSGR